MTTILFLAASPYDRGQIRFDREFRDIEFALHQSDAGGSFQLVPSFQIRTDELQRLLMKYKPEVVHFCGHGSNSGEIFFVGDDGTSRPVSIDSLIRIFSIHGKTVRCIVLNACYSDALAQALIQHVECVVCTSHEIIDQASINFARAFYQALAFGESIETAFLSGKAEVHLSKSDEPDKLRLFGNATSKLVFVPVSRTESNVPLKSVDSSIQMNHMSPNAAHDNPIRSQLPSHRAYTDIIEPWQHKPQPRNRIEELKLFQDIITRRTTLRGIALHSNGDGGWGKTWLLHMFRRECERHQITWHVTAFLFGNTKGSRWKNFMDHTAEKVGPEYFQRYFEYSTVRFSQNYNSMRNSIDELEWDSTNQSGTGQTGNSTYSSSYSSSSLSHTTESLNDFRSRLTHLFFECLDSIPGQVQVVWLVDQLEDFDPETQNWLSEICGHIAQEQIKRLILVTASRDPIYLPHWQKKIRLFDVCNFKKESMIIELLGDYGHDGTAYMKQMVASKLIEDTKGNLLRVCMDLEKGHQKEM